MQTCALVSLEKSEQLRVSPEHEHDAPAGGFVGKMKTTVFVGMLVTDGIIAGGFVNVGRFVDVTATVGRIKIAV